MFNWPTKKLGEVIEERKEKNLIKKSLPVFTVSHIYGLIPYQSVFYKRIHSIDTSNYKIVRKFNFAFGLPTKDTLPFGLLEQEEAVLVSPAYIVFSIKDHNKLYPKFLFYLFKTNRYKRIVIEKAKSHGATRHGLPLKFNHLSSLEIPLPPLPIQQKIVYVLDTIESAVEVQENIIEKTKELKKSLMYEIFNPKSKSQKSKLKFKIKKWVKLGEVCRLRKEQCLPKGGDKYVGLEHLESGESTIRKFGLGEEVRSSKNKFYPGDILYGKLRPYLDKVALSNFEGICSTDLLVLVCDKEKILPEYLINILHLPKFLNFAISTTSGTNHPRTSWGTIKTFLFPIHYLNDQRKIAEILQTIDQKIEIEQKKKALYEELFKTVLNKIFKGEIDVEKIEI